MSSLKDGYDRFYRSTGPVELPEITVTGWPRDRIEAIVAMGGEGDTVLDVGCGDGRLLYQFRHRFRRLIGLEYSPARLEQARANLGPDRFTGLQGSAEDLSEIDTGSIDWMISADTIEHIPDVYRATDEMFRVLRPGGTLVINTPNIAFMKKRLLLLLGRFPATSQPNEGLGSDILFDGGHLHYFTYRALALLLQRSGFVLTRRVGFGKLGRLHDLYPPLLSVGVQWVAQKPR